MDKVEVSGTEADPLSKPVKRFAKSVIPHLFPGRRPAWLGIILTDDTEVERLNVTYRHKEGSTDVLSFEDDLVDDKGRHHLGEIYVSIPFAERTRGENKLERYVLFLVAHGLLHLTGMDHATEDERLRMIELGEELLERFA